MPSILCNLYVEYAAISRRYCYNCRISVANQTLDDEPLKRIQEATERYSQLGSAHDRSGRRKPAVTKRCGDADDASKASPSSQSPDRISLTAPDSSHSLDDDCCSKVRLCSFMFSCLFKLASISGGAGNERALVLLLATQLPSTRCVALRYGASWIIWRAYLSNTPRLQIFNLRAVP